MQRIILSLSIFLTLSPINVYARWLQAVSVNIENSNGRTKIKLLDPVNWFDRIDLHESTNPQNRSFLTGARGDLYDCSNDIVPPGALLDSVAYYSGDINPQLPERLNRLEIHRVEDCEDDDPIEVALEVEEGWGGGEIGPDEEIPAEYQNPWVRYNNNPDDSGDPIEEEKSDREDAIEEEPPLEEHDSEFQWISRSDAGFKKLRKRDPQNPPDPEEEEKNDNDQPPKNQAQSQRAGNFNSPQPNINPNRRLEFNFEPLTPVSEESQRPDLGNNQNQPNLRFRQLNLDFQGGFGGGGEGQADWDPMQFTTSEDPTNSIQFPLDRIGPEQERRNEFPVRFPADLLSFDEMRVPITQDFRIHDPHGLLTNRQAAPIRSTAEWLQSNFQDDNASVQPVYGNIPPTRPDIDIFHVKLWPDLEIELGPSVSFRFVFDPYVVHDTEND
ncbi:hypothetical protein TWF281_011629 [Arthrobotrys megalospora]